MEKLVQAVAAYFIPVEASGRHVHLDSGQALALFGEPLMPEKPLSQPGQIVAKQRVTVIGPKGRFPNVAVLGPERKEAQLQTSLPDTRTLGLSVPIHLSGDVSDSPGVVLESETGKVVLHKGVICAKRHIHLTPEDALRFGVKNGQEVTLQTFGERGTKFPHTVVRVSPDFSAAAHLDYDAANACGFQKGDLGRILP